MMQAPKTDSQEPAADAKEQRNQAQKGIGRHRIQEGQEEGGLQDVWRGQEGTRYTSRPQQACTCARRSSGCLIGLLSKCSQSCSRLARRKLIAPMGDSAC